MKTAVFCCSTVEWWIEHCKQMSLLQFSSFYSICLVGTFATIWVFFLLLLPSFVQLSSVPFIPFNFFSHQHSSGPFFIHFQIYLSMSMPMPIHSHHFTPHLFYKFVHYSTIIYFFFASLAQPLAILLLSSLLLLLFLCFFFLSSVGLSSSSRKTIYRPHRMHPHTHTRTTSMRREKKNRKIEC